MKKHKIIKIIASLALTITTIFTVNTTIHQSFITQAANKSYKGYKTKHTLTYKDKKGKMTITGIEALNMLYGLDDEAGPQIIIYGTFTNYSKHRISPDDFYSNHFKTYQIKSKHYHKLIPVAPIVMTPTKHIEKLSNNAEDYVKSHKTVKFALSDNDPRSLSEHQKVNIKALYPGKYKDIVLASKNFIAPETQNAMDYHDVDTPNDNPYTSPSFRKEIDKVAKEEKIKAKKQKKFISKISNYDVYKKGNYIYFPKYGKLGLNAPVIRNKNYINIFGFFENTSKITAPLNDIMSKYLTFTYNGQPLNFKVADSPKQVKVGENIGIRLAEPETIFYNSGSTISISPKIGIKSNNFTYNLKVKTDKYSFEAK